MGELNPKIRYYIGEDGHLTPDLELSEPDIYLGLMGRKRMEYLEEHKPKMFIELFFEGTLKQHCLEMENQADEMMDTIIKQMKEADGVTEALKASDMLEWVRRMNTIRNTARSIVMREIILA